MAAYKTRRGARSDLHQNLFFLCLRVRRGIFVFHPQHGCLFEGLDLIEQIEVVLVIVAGFEDFRGNRAGGQPLPAGGGGCNVIAVFKILLRRALRALADWQSAAGYQPAPRGAKTKRLSTQSSK